MSPSDDPLNFAGIHSLFLKLSYMRSIMQTCPIRRPLKFRWNPFTFFKALLYEEYYADMSPSDDPYFARIHSLFLKLSYMRSIMQTCPLQTIPCFARIHSLFLKLSYMRSIMQTCPLQTIPCFAGIHSLFFKALLYEEYYADMSPSDESLDFAAK